MHSGKLAFSASLSRMTSSRALSCLYCWQQISGMTTCPGGTRYRIRSDCQPERSNKGHCQTDYSVAMRIMPATQQLVGVWQACSAKKTDPVLVGLPPLHHGSKSHRLDTAALKMLAGYAPQKPLILTDWINVRLHAVPFRTRSPGCPPCLHPCASNAIPLCVHPEFQPPHIGRRHSSPNSAFPRSWGQRNEVGVPLPFAGCR